ncbi:hypothetical protein [Paenibacillus alkalitolerans]|uniref:hypothetical protein n=1 Tax=Paenibacillus alkalitolerans TaxID=2799335 RepID=UPI0018F75446|nr:hypothetical protein [Paenibacillus alkalitolerans]
MYSRVPRTERAMTQEHAFMVAELCLKEQVNLAAERVAGSDEVRGLILWSPYL